MARGGDLEFQVFESIKLYIYIYTYIYPVRYILYIYVGPKQNPAYLSFSISPSLYLPLFYFLHL